MVGVELRGMLPDRSNLKSLVVVQDELILQCRSANVKTVAAYLSNNGILALQKEKAANLIFHKKPGFTLGKAVFNSPLCIQPRCRFSS